VQAYTEVVVILPIERLFVFELESFQGVTDYRLDVDPLREVFRALFWHYPSIRDAFLLARLRSMLAFPVADAFGQKRIGIWFCFQSFA